MRNWWRGPMSDVAAAQDDLEADAVLLGEVRQERIATQNARDETRAQLREIRRLTTELHDIADEIRQEAEERENE